MYKKRFLFVIFLLLFFISCNEEKTQETLFIEKKIKEHTSEKIPHSTIFLISVNFYNGVCDDCSEYFSKYLQEKMKSVSPKNNYCFITNNKEELRGYIGNEHNIIESKDILFSIADPLSNLSLIKFNTKTKNVEKIVLLKNSIKEFLSEVDILISEE